jgi:hypothetical protein
MNPRRPGSVDGRSPEGRMTKISAVSCPVPPCRFGGMCDMTSEEFAARVG